MAGRLNVLLAHLLPQQPSSLTPGSRGEAPWSITSTGPLVIVGGICLDIQAQPSTVDVHRGTSVPGTVRQVPGGVGRNMAEALSGLLPADRPAPVFVSLVGDDTAGAFLAASLRRLRLDLSLLMTCPGAPTPCVSAILDRGGEVAAAVADVTSVEQLLTPERLRECSAQLQQACLVLAEANLSAAALQFVASTAAAARVPVFLEPVSVPKAERLAPSLPYATFVSPNAAELMAIADCVRRSAGLPRLPRPVLPEPGGPGGAGGPGAGAAEAEEEPGAVVAELLRQLAAFAEVLLLEGTACVVLTLGSLGAALITLQQQQPDGAAAAAEASPSSALGLEACSAPQQPHPTHPTARARAPPALALAACSACAPAARPHAAGGRPLPAPPGTCGSCAASDRIWHPAAPGCHAAAAAAVGPLGRVRASAPLPPPPPGTGEAVGEGEGSLVAAAAGGALQAAGAAGLRGVEVLHLRALPAEVVSVNGAGDTLVAGMIAALLERHPPAAALAYGMAAAKRAVESHRNVPDLAACAPALRADAEAVLATLRRHRFPSALAAAV